MPLPGPLRYQLAIFDFDGILEDSFPWFLGVFGRLVDEFKFRKIEDHEVEAFRGQAARQLMAHLRVPAWKLPWIACRFRRWCQGLIFEAMTSMTPISRPRPQERAVAWSAWMGDSSDSGARLVESVKGRELASESIFRKEESPWDSSAPTSCRSSPEWSSPAC